MGKALIFSAPSGSGKTTIVRELLGEFPSLEFSISATSRTPRGAEVDGKDYYFMSSEEFAARVANDEFVEWEEVYSGTCYGTLRTEIERIWNKGNVVVFDIDVVGAINIKRLFDNNALSIFIMPPSIEELRKRLKVRATDTPQAIDKRIEKAGQELTYAPRFDITIINDDLKTAINQTADVVRNFIRE